MSANSPEKITVAVGPPGEWGSAFASIVAERGHNVRLLMRYPEDVLEFEATRRTRRLEGVDFPENVKAYSDPKECFDGADLFAVAATSQSMRPFIESVRPNIGTRCVVMSLTKGLEQGTNLRMSEILLENDIPIENIAVLSGPNLAKEVVHTEVVAGTTVAAYEFATAEKIQGWLNSERFRVYTTDDVVGVEIGAVIKNIFALGGGIADSLRVAGSSKATFISRAFEEMVRVGVGLGGREETFRGPSGLGDLLLGCYPTGEGTRNYRAGVKKVQGQTLEEIREAELVEGLNAIESLVKIIDEKLIDAPLIKTIFKVFFKGLSIKEGINQLMERQPTKDTLKDKGFLYGLARFGFNLFHKLGLHHVTKRLLSK